MPGFFSAQQLKPARAALLALTGAFCASLSAQTPPPAPAACQPVYLALDTRHMAAMPMLIEALHFQKVRATVFAADETQKNGKTALGYSWGPWFKARAKEGYDLVPRTWERVQWRADLPGREPRFRMFIHEGAFAGREFTWKGSQYCESLNHTAERLNYYSNKPPLKLFHAEEEQTSPRLLETARACGYQHVNWTPATFLASPEWLDGKQPYGELTRQVMQALPPHPVLLIGSGMWDGVDGWKVGGVIRQFIAQAQAQGYCFRPLREHPDYQSWLQEHPYEDKP